MQLYTAASDYKITKIMVGITIATCMVLIRLAYLQINLQEYFSLKSKKNFLRFETTQSPRGNILDRHGILLATNRPVTSLVWQGTGNNYMTEDQKQILSALEDILHIPFINDAEKYHEIIHAEKLYKEVLLSNDLSFDQLSQIEERFPNLTNISITTHFQRYYPTYTHACHIIGYLGGHADLEPLGQMGLEKTCEHILKGKEGTILKTINSFGRNITQETTQEAAAGDDIYTTLDLNLQSICEQVFPESHAGAFIVMHAQTGDILALISRPHFDPNVFLHPISLPEWQLLQEKRPFLNRAFNACYPPGSIFKLITVSAALEHNIISPHATVRCKGYVSFAGRNYWCSKKYGHGILSVADAVAESCNTLFFDIAKHIDIDLLANYAHKFGLGQKTEQLFPEKIGIVPSRQWKLQAKGEPWWPGETLSATIGQSFLLVTPIQIARMIASIFTGYLVSPRILSTQEIIKEPLDLLPETRKFLKKSMKKVVTTGTGKRVGRVKNVEIYAKTSTAQTSALEKRNLGTSYLEHGWFVSYFKYKEEPPLTLVIVVENAGTAAVATTVAKNFLIEYKKIIDAVPIVVEQTV